MRFGTHRTSSGQPGFATCLEGILQKKLQRGNFQGPWQVSTTEAGLGLPYQDQAAFAVVLSLRIGRDACAHATPPPSLHLYWLGSP